MNYNFLLLLLYFYDVETALNIWGFRTQNPVNLRTHPATSCQLLERCWILDTFYY